MEYETADLAREVAALTGHDQTTVDMYAGGSRRVVTFLGPIALYNDDRGFVAVMVPSRHLDGALVVAVEIDTTELEIDVAATILVEITNAAPAPVSTGIGHKKPQFSGKHTSERRRSYGSLGATTASAWRGGRA